MVSFPSIQKIGENDAKIAKNNLFWQHNLHIISAFILTPWTHDITVESKIGKKREFFRKIIFTKV